MLMLIYCNFILYIDQGLIFGGIFGCCLVQTSSESHSSFSVMFANGCVLGHKAAGI